MLEIFPMQKRTSRLASDRMLICVLGGTLAPLLAISALSLVLKWPLWRGVTAGGQEFNPTLLSIGLASVFIGSLIGCSLVRSKEPPSLGIWASSAVISSIVFIQEITLLGYFNLWLVDAAAFGVALLFMMILRIRSRWK
jgi:hypothetical protein